MNIEQGLRRIDACIVETQLGNEAGDTMVKALRAQQALLGYSPHNACGKERTTVCTQTTDCILREAEVSVVSESRTARMNVDDDATIRKVVQAVISDPKAAGSTRPAEHHKLAVNSECNR